MSVELFSILAIAAPVAGVVLLALAGRAVRTRRLNRRIAMAAANGWELRPFHVNTIPWVESYFPRGSVRFAAEVRPGLIFAEHIVFVGKHERRNDGGIRLMIAADDPGSREVVSLDAGDGWSVCVEHGRVIMYLGPYSDGDLLAPMPPPEKWPELVETGIRVASRALGRTIARK